MGTPPRLTVSNSRRWRRPISPHRSGYFHCINTDPFHESWITLVVLQVLPLLWTQEPQPRRFQFLFLEEWNTVAATVVLVMSSKEEILFDVGIVVSVFSIRLVQSDVSRHYNHASSFFHPKSEDLWHDCSLLFPSNSIRSQITENINGKRGRLGEGHRKIQRGR